MDRLELMYFEKELSDIRAFCIKNGLTTRYQNRDYYLYDHKIYDENMDTIIDRADNGFLDLFEYYEYFAPPTTEEEPQHG